MKNIDIQKIRNLLNERIAIAKVSADNENYLIKFTIKDAESILALLPCETCGGTKQVPTPQSIGFGKQNEIVDICPDCQQNEDLKNVTYPICPVNMYFEGDEDKCDVTHCDFDTEIRSCSEGCVIDVGELQKELDEIKPRCTKGKLEIGGEDSEGRIVVSTYNDDNEFPCTPVAIIEHGLAPTKAEAEANAKKLVYRWNAFEKDELVPDLLNALEMAENWLTAISKREGGLVLMVQACPYEADNHTRRKIQTALEKGRENE